MEHKQFKLESTYQQNLWCPPGIGPWTTSIFTLHKWHSLDNLKFYLFANDTNILYADKNLKAIEQTVNVELNNVHDWLTTNRLILNTKKIKVLNVSSSSEKKNAFFSTNKYIRQAKGESL